MGLEFSFEEGEGSWFLGSTWKFIVLGWGKLRECPSYMRFGFIFGSIEQCTGTWSQRSVRGAVCSMEVLWGFIHWWMGSQWNCSSIDNMCSNFKQHVIRQAATFVCTEDILCQNQSGQPRQNYSSWGTMWSKSELGSFMLLEWESSLSYWSYVADKMWPYRCLRH